MNSPPQSTFDITYGETMMKSPVTSPRRHAARRAAQPDRSKPKEQDGLAEDLISCAGSKAMADIIVEANDGGEIPASSFVLGARSPVFQQMLFGGAHPRRLKLDHGTNVVRALVYYCRTNELDQTWQTMKEKEEAVRELVKLGDSANYFELDGLALLVRNMVIAVIKIHPHLACAIYDEAAAHGEKVEGLKSIALDAIRQNPEATLLRRNDSGSHEAGIVSLSPTFLEEIVGDRCMCADELTMFKAVVVWSKGIDGDVMARRIVQERRIKAKEMVSTCIDLSKIAPSDLLGTVNDSGFVDPMEITNALTQLALRLEQEGATVPQPRASTSKRGTTPKRKGSRHQIVVQPLPSEAEGDDNSVVDQEGASTGSTDDAVVLEPPQVKRSQKTSPGKNKKQETPTITPAGPQQEYKSGSSTTPKNSPSRRSSKNSPPKRTIGQSVGIFLAEQVDTFCFQQNSCPDIPK